jgi:radical SAM superfamily enzyme YgiQ (UPF0313 family)
MPPLGLGYLQSFLTQNKIDAQILDLNHIFYQLCDDNLKKQWLVSCNVFLEENILSIIKTKHAKEYRRAIDELLTYDTIGFSCFKSNFGTTLEIAELLKSKREDIKIILGGPEITRQFFKGAGKFDNKIIRLADFLVVGEGERPLLSYLKRQNHKKIAIAKPTAIAVFKQLKDLSNLPFPKYPNLDLGAYPKKDALPIQFSRGCIRRCGFCSERLLYKGFRTREVESVIEEIKYHKENNHANYFVFFDSLLNADLVKLEDLCAKIIDSFGAINWEAQVAIRDDMKEDIFAKMKRSGCYNLFVGLESGSDNTLKKMNKGFTTKGAAGFFEKLDKAGLSFGVSMIVGYPGETDLDFKESLDFIIQNKGIIPKIEQVNPFTYYDGTDADKNYDYKINKNSLERMGIFIREIKRNNFKYTNAFLGNLVEKDVRV